MPERLPPPWLYKIDEYWSFNSDHGRQHLLLKYFKEVKVIDESIKLLDESIAEQINDWGCFKDMRRLGKADIQRERKYHELRRCFLAEYLYVVKGLKREDIHQSAPKYKRARRKKSLGAKLYRR